MTRRSVLGATAATAEVEGVRLAFDAGGSGPALVCLHAIGHGASDFARIRERFQGRFRVIALDWPGQGNSAADHLAPSAARYAGLLRGFLDAIGVEEAVLLGNSIGGAAALRFAAAHPDRVAALVLANPGGIDRIDWLGRTVCSIFARFFAFGARGARWFPAAFALYYRIVLPGPAAAAQRARIVATAREIAPLLAQAWTSFSAPEADLRSLVPQVSCPVLVAWAKHDRILRLRRNLPAIRRFPNAKLETFEAGHSAFLETPEAFEASLERFLASLPPRSSPGAGDLE
jgi:pimeloyl-ACP methyl ester carboxylesterase